MNHTQLESMRSDYEGCSRCSSCKWIPHAQIMSWRFAKSCPSVDRYNFHAYSASGKLNMALSIIDKRSELNDAVASVIYRCQLCGACQVACQNYRDDIDHCDAFHIMRSTCVQEGFVLPEHLDIIESMKREDNTMGLPKAQRGDWAAGLDIPDINTQKVEVLFHAGCRYSYDEELHGTVRKWASFLKKAGVAIGIAGRDEACCGGRAYEIGYQGEMKNYAEDMAGRVKASGAHTLVTPCSDCYYTFKYLYPKNRLGLNVKVLHTTELTDALVRQGKIQLKNSVPLTVTYHDPCHLGRRGESYKSGWTGEVKLMRPVQFKQTGREGIFDEPRNLIKAVPGVELREMERIREYSWCCGAGGGVLEAEPGFAVWTAKDRLEEARATGAEAIVTACPWCEHLFAEALKETGDTLKVLDVVDLLEMGWGGN